MAAPAYDFIVIGAGSAGCAARAGLQHKLNGTDGLWVADASVMPAVTSANTNAPSMMIGHRAAQMIAADAAHHRYA